MNLQVLLALALLVAHGCGQTKTGIHPSSDTVTEAVYASATVVPREAYTASPSANGIIEWIDLQEGATVNQGDVLFRIDDRQAELERERTRQLYTDARESYRGNAAVLREMEERLATARLGRVNDSINFARQVRLWDQQIGSKQALETMELRFRTARNTVRELERAYARTREELANQVELAETALRMSEEHTDDYVTRAEMTGTVYEVFKEVGEAVTTQMAVARIGSTHDFIIELLIDEVDVARVREGQRVVVLLDAYPEQPLEAELTRILPHKDSRSQTFTAEAVFIRRPDRLYDGLSGEANIVVARRENVLTLPTEFIGPDRTVMTPDGERRVETGISDLRVTEILGGIDSSTVVYQP